MAHTEEKLAKDIANGRIAKLYQKEGIVLAATGNYHILLAAKADLATYTLKELQRIQKAGYDAMHQTYDYNRIAEELMERIVELEAEGKE